MCAVALVCTAQLPPAKDPVFSLKAQETQPGLLPWMQGILSVEVHSPIYLHCTVLHWDYISHDPPPFSIIISSSQARCCHQEVGGKKGITQPLCHSAAVEEREQALSIAYFEAPQRWGRMKGSGHRSTQPAPPTGSTPGYTSSLACSQNGLETMGFVVFIEKCT